MGARNFFDAAECAAMLARGYLRTRVIEKEGDGGKTGGFAGPSHREGRVVEVAEVAIHKVQVRRGEARPGGGGIPAVAGFSTTPIPRRRDRPAALVVRRRDPHRDVVVIASCEIGQGKQQQRRRQQQQRQQQRRTRTRTRTMERGGR